MSSETLGMPSFTGLVRVVLASTVVKANIETASITGAESLSQNLREASTASKTNLRWVLAPGIWAPGRGEGCYGVWTQSYLDNHNGSLPTELVDKFLSMGMEPELLQRIRNGTCPYGSVLPGQVTWPHATVDSIMQLDLLTFVAVIYSYVPYMLGAYVIINTIISIVTRACNGLPVVTTTRLYVLLWLAQALFIQETILKQIFKQPRPGTMLQVRNEDGRFVGSCVESCGMPSSHSMLAMGWVTILLFDRIYRVSQFTITDRTNHACREQCRHEVKSFWRFLTFLSLKPWSTGNLSHVEFMAHIALWSVLLVPVPVMRVLLHDHTMQQAMAGSLVGVFDALIWWRVSRALQQRYHEFEDKGFPTTGCCKELFFHDFKLPHVPDSVQDAVKLTAESLDGTWMKMLAEPLNSSRSGLPTQSLDGEFYVTRSQLPMRLIVRGYDRYPRTLTPPELCIVHVDSRKAFVTFRNIHGELEVNSDGGVCDRVQWKNGDVWVRRRQGDVDLASTADTPSLDQSGSRHSAQLAIDDTALPVSSGFIPTARSPSKGTGPDVTVADDGDAGSDEQSRKTN